MGGLATAGAIAAALLKRERTGETSVVDVSLLATAMWQVSPMIIASKLFGFSKIPQGDRKNNGNPGVGTYRTADDRFISAHPPAVGQVLGRLRQAPRRARHGHRPAVLRRRRSGRPTHGPASSASTRPSAASPSPTGRRRWTTFDGVWSAVPDLRRALRRRAGPGQRLPALRWRPATATTIQLVASPAQFDEVAVEVTRAPEHGEHTELVLIDPGYDWDQLAALKESGAIL